MRVNYLYDEHRCSEPLGITPGALSVPRSGVVAIIPIGEFRRQLEASRQNNPTRDYQLENDGRYGPSSNGQLPDRRGNPVPDSFDNFGAIGAAIDAICLFRRVAPSGFARELFDSGPIGVPPGVRNARDRLFQGLCRETPNTTEIVEPAIPTGGQCDGQLYSVSASGVVRGNDPECNLVTNRSYGPLPRWGPIGGARVFSDGSGQFLQLYDRGSGNDDIEPLAWRNVSSWPGNLNCPRGGVVQAFSASPIGGFTDDCGEAPLRPVPDPNEPPIPGIEIEVPRGGGGSQRTPVNFRFDPEIGIAVEVGDISFTFDGANIDIDIEANFGGGSTDLPPGQAPRVRCDPPTPADRERDPTTPIPPAPPDAEEPPPEDRSETAIVAVIVTSENIATPSTPIDPGDGQPVVWAPRLGTVQFFVEDADGNGGWLEDIDVKNARQWIDVPSPQGATDVRAFPFGLTQFTITRILREIPVP